MENNNTIVSFNPTQQQKNEIETWLIKEDQKTGEGFYCNWSVIESAFSKNKMATISLEKKTIGFATWLYTSDLTARIDIFEINPAYRKKGFGRILTKELFTYFKSNGISVLTLQCSPPSSEPVWRKLGFIDFPEFMTTKSNKKLYQILTPFSSTTAIVDDSEFIELWNSESSWIWKLEFKGDTRELIHPIIHACDDDWTIKWKFRNQVVKEDTVKYLSKEEIHFDEFLIINKMIELPITP